MPLILFVLNKKNSTACPINHCSVFLLCVIIIIIFFFFYRFFTNFLEVSFATNKLLFKILTKKLGKQLHCLLEFTQPRG